MLPQPTPTRDWQSEELSNPASRHCQWMSEEATAGVANEDVVRWLVECERLKFLRFSLWHMACRPKLGSTGPCANIRMVEVMSLVRENRDLRIDVFRGLALWWIFSDHIPGDVLGDYSLRNFALCDATEVFVLLAGFSAGSAYGSTMNRHGYAYAAADVLRRVWTLFVVHVFIFVVYAALVGCSADILGRSSYLDESHLDVLAGAPYRALLEALFLRYQPSLLNILPLYIVLLLIFSVALPLLRRPKLLADAINDSLFHRARCWNQSSIIAWYRLVLQSSRMAVAVYDRRDASLHAGQNA
jgi:OpgC protein